MSNYNQAKRILFINFGGLGDEILFLPTILSVKKEFPDSHITLVLEERSKGIQSLTNVIDETLFANIKGKNKYFQMFQILLKIWRGKYKRGKYDLVISSGSNKFIALFLALTFIKKRYGYDTGKLSQMLLTKAIVLNKNQYAVNMYHDLVKYITSKKTELPILNVSKSPIEANSVLIHPGVSKISVEKGMIKTVDATVWAKVIELLADSGKKVFLIGGPDDKDCIETITRIVPCEKFENLYGTTKNLKDLAELISSKEIFVCSDSAPLHIAVSLGVKTYVIFGSTDDKKLIPQSEKVVPIKAKCACSLQPCLWEKRQTTCESLDCLKILPEEIVEKVLS